MNPYDSLMNPAARKMILRENLLQWVPKVAITCPETCQKYGGNFSKGNRKRRSNGIAGSVFPPSSVSGQCGLSVLTSAKEELSRCITMTFTPPFILALSNGLWTANPPHRGVAALSLRPPIPTHTHYNRANKRRGEWGPSAAWPVQPG